MSRVGKKPIVVPNGVTVEVKEETISVKGKNAELSVPVLAGIKVEYNEGEIAFIPRDKKKQTLSNWGTLRSLTQNAISGVSEDFEKTLMIEGVGYRANVEGNELVLGLGFSHPVRFKIPDGVKITAEKNVIKVSGADKALVGKVAAEIRLFRKPEPYKGKGIRYSDEIIRRKAGKKAASSEK